MATNTAAQIMRSERAAGRKLWAYAYPATNYRVSTVTLECGCSIDADEPADGYVTFSCPNCS